MRSLKHESSVEIVTINENSGDIMTCTKHVCAIWTINGDKIASTTSCNDYISSAAFFDGKSTDVFETNLLLTGHRSGCIKIWKLEFRSLEENHGIWELKLMNIFFDQVNIPITVLYFHG